VKKALFAILVLGVFATAASAAQPVSHAASGTISDPVGDLRLGGAITFTSTTDNLKGWQYPLIDLECSQNGTVVFSQLDAPNAIFLLGGGSSRWLETGGSATCVAYLDAYGTKGGNWDITLLATGATFEAAG
jgi:hypothetical protein